MSPLEELQQRIEKLERQVAVLITQASSSASIKNWQRTIGMFTGDEVMQRINEEAARYRAQDREAARTDPNYFDGDSV